MSKEIGVLDRLIQGMSKKPDSSNGLHGIVIVQPHGLAEADIRAGFAAGKTIRSELLGRVKTFLEASPMSGSARWLPGDRIAITIEGAGNRRAVEDMVDKLTAEIDRPMLAGDVPVWIRPRVGISIAAPGHETTENMLRDAAAGATADNGTGTLFGIGDRNRLTRENRTRSELHAAIENDRLDLYLEPVVSLHDQQIRGFRAHARWEHPSQGTVMVQSLPVFEADDQLASAVTRWTTNAATDWIAELRNGGVTDVPQVQVDFNAAMANHPRTPEWLRELTTAKRLPSASLLARINVVDFYDDDVVENIRALKQAGVATMIVGVGSPDSAITRFAQAPVEAMEIAPSLIAAIEEGSQDAGLLDTIAGMGDTLGTTLQGAGVESSAHIDQLLRIGVFGIVGSHVAEPVLSTSVRDQGDFDSLVSQLDLPDPVAPATEPDSRGRHVTLSDCADAIGVSRQTVRRLIDRGELIAVRDERGHRQVRQEELAAYIRGRYGAGRLRRRRLVQEPLRAAAGLLARRGNSLARDTAMAMYEPHNPGWFAEQRSYPRTRFWLDSLARSLSGTDPRSAVEATGRFLADAGRAGARPAECIRFIEQFGAQAARHLQGDGVPPGEARNFSQLLRAGCDEYLESLG